MRKTACVVSFYRRRIIKVKKKESKLQRKPTRSAQVDSDFSISHFNHRPIEAESCFYSPKSESLSIFHRKILLLYQVIARSIFSCEII